MRRVLVSGAVLVALASCSTFDTDFVAEVDGEELDEADVEQMISSPVASDLLQTTVLDDGMARSSKVRDLISLWIALTAVDHAGFVDQGTLDEAREQFTAQYGEGWTETPAEMQDVALLYGAVGAMRVEARDAGRENEFVTQLRTIVEAADIRVSSHYGRWDDQAFGVIPLG